MVFEIVLWGIFAIGFVAALGGLAYGVVSRFRDHRTPQERWADEHGAEDQGDLTPAGPQTLWFGTGL